MKLVIAHREVSGVFLCHEGIHWYWGPREQAKEYSLDTARELMKSFPDWKGILGVDCHDALVQIDPRTRSTAPPPG
jgi:hypothetical protein